MSFIKSGSELRDDLLNLQITRTPIIDEFLFERDIFMLSADAGAGKSIFALNLLGCLSFPAGKTFMGCKIMNPKKVLYIQLEGDYEESIERLRYMEEGGLILEESNICIVEEKTLNVMDNGSIGGFFKRINDHKFIPEVIIIDPIYKLAHGDPSTGVVALAVIRFSDLLYHKFNCTNVLIHHNLKDSYFEGKKIEKDDAFYGHSFIKNHIRTSYAMKVTGANTRMLIRKKGRGSDTKSKLALEYDPETQILSLDETSRQRKGNALERILSFIQECKERDKMTESDEVCNVCDISYGRLRHIKLLPQIIERVEFKKMPPKNKEIWRPK